MPIVYKYCKPDRIDILEARKIMLSRPGVFNDPFELKPHYECSAEFVLPVPQGATESARAQIAEMQRRINEQVFPPSAIDTVLENATQTIVLLSLSENRDSLLMWAHYAAAHTGFVIGFSEPGEILAIDSPHRHIAKVTYSDVRPSHPTFEEITNDELLLTKSKEWEYEQEWRILDSLYSADGDATREAPDCWPFKFRPESIKEVIVGCRASEEFAKRIEGALDKPPYRHVQQLRAFRHRRDYKLRFAPIWDKEW
jgi:hypothetical protein